MVVKLISFVNRNSKNIKFHEKIFYAISVHVIYHVYRFWPHSIRYFRIYRHLKKIYDSMRHCQWRLLQNPFFCISYSICHAYIYYYLEWHLTCHCYNAYIIINRSSSSSSRCLASSISFKSIFLYIYICMYKQQCQLLPITL